MVKAIIWAMLLTPVYQQNLVAFVVDEAHCQYMIKMNVKTQSNVITQSTVSLVNHMYVSTYQLMGAKGCGGYTHAMLLLDIWPSTIWPMRIAVLITTAEAFDNILFVLLQVQERYACVYTSGWNGSQTSILVVQCNWHHF